MKTKLALSAFVAAVILSACGSKTEAPPAPAADATPPASAAADASAAASDASAASAAADAASAAASSAKP